MKFLALLLASLLSLTSARRHLCEDLTLPDCSNGDKASYNPTGENTGHPCPSDNVAPVCADGSEAKIRNNVCDRMEKQCPQGQGKDGTAEPFDVCGDGSFPRCPGGQRATCPFHLRKCADRSEPRKQCKVGKPHCPWFTKNRNNPWNLTEKKFNRGPNRPQNKNKN